MEAPLKGDKICHKSIDLLLEQAMFSHFQFCENLKNALESIQRNQPNIRAKHQHTQLKGSQFATAGSLLKTTPVKLTGNSQQPQKSESPQIKR